ncbi:2-C-methyl-D-erythritol 4-phosphate cytidylyltransferase [Clostridia bacterium]|nr:2-C-methyl-D-erythritol 4-phosphate cytidylyltransferase [Clostridia bacterium]
MAIRVTALILAAGASSRAGVDKIFADLYGKPALLYSLMAFEQARTIDDIIIVAAQSRVSEVKRMCLEHTILKMKQIYAGGETRVMSAEIGLSGCVQSHYVAIHDGARPLVTPDEIDRTVEAAKRYRAAILAAPVRETIKVVSRADGGGGIPGAEDDKVVRLTPDRRVLYAAQTPQVFETKLYSDSLALLPDDVVITDDASIVERNGVAPYIVEGGNTNIKLTYSEDLMMAELLLRVRMSGE